MSRPPMETQDPLLQRYQEANALDAARPSAALRDTVLAHAKRHAAMPATPINPQKQAANDAPWRWRALGSLAVMGLVGLLLTQFERGSPEEHKVALGTATAPIDTSAAAPRAKASTPMNEPLGTTTAQGKAESPPAATPQRPANPTPAAPPVVADTSALSRAAPAAKAVAPDAAAAADKAATAEALAPAAAAPEMEQAPAMAQADAAAPTARAKSAARDPSRGEAPPLHAAATRGDLAAVQNLIAQGADVNARDALGRTPLMLAAMGRLQPLLSALMDAGADPTWRDHAGLTAADHAQQAGHADWLPLLQPRR